MNGGIKKWKKLNQYKMKKFKPVGEVIGDVIGYAIGNYDDTIIGHPYDLYEVNAKELSDFLKANLSKKGIDYQRFNPDFNIGSEYSYGFKDKQGVINDPPKELYEYQNFVLYYNDITDEYHLLDGFRRLLWYNTPDTPIRVRVYSKSSNDGKKVLDDKQILTLLLHLNHFKFHAGNNYMERGFALLLYDVFGLDISKYKKAFDSYLCSDKIKSDYGSNNMNPDKKNKHVKERILNDFFLYDVHFMEACENAGCMVNTYFGAVLYRERMKSDKEFDSDLFIKLSKENDILKNLQYKQARVGTASSSDSIKYVNQILEMYNNIFKQMNGEVIEKSYAENLQDCKDLVASLKKDKDWTKLTGSNSCYKIERLMRKMLANGEEMKFKCVVYPEEYVHRHKLECGLREDIKFLREVVHRNAWMRKENVMVFGFKVDDVEWIVDHNYGGNAKQYTTLEHHGIPIESYRIELFININQKTVKEL